MLFNDLYLRTKNLGVVTFLADGGTQLSGGRSSKKRTTFSIFMKKFEGFKMILMELQEESRCLTLMTKLLIVWSYDEFW